MNKSTLRTVLTAGAANLVIALCKLVAGLVSGSSAMLAESAHSVADTVNQVFLLTSLRTGARPADAEHPFGYGQERYFWSLLAAVGIFVAGAGFSIFDGVLAITSGERSGSTGIAYVVLAISFIAEGTSLTRAARQMSGEARQRRRPLFDIGLLLVVVAYRLGRDSRDGLIGHAIDPDEQRMIADEIRSTPGIDNVVELRTMHLGPESVIVAARVAFSDDISADRAEDIAGDIDWRLRERMSVMPHVFIDPTQT